MDTFDFHGLTCAKFIFLDDHLDLRFAYFIYLAKRVNAPSPKTKVDLSG